MALSLNKPKLDNLAGDIWKSAERLRGKFKAYEYQGVILPIIVIRRLECVLLAWREAKRAEVLAKRPKLTEKELAKLVKELELNPKQSPFSNKTDWTLRKVYEEDHALLEENFRKYINGFSKNVDDIIEHFNYRATIGTMVKNNRLAPILNQYKELALGPDQLSGLEMGYVYEELLRRFSEQSGEEAGDHFTPREIIRLMVELLEIPIPVRHFSIYDLAAGTSGMLSVAKEHLLDRATTPEEKERVEKFLTVHGQELSPTNYAVCQADLLIKNDQQVKIFLGNSLIPHDPHSRDPGDQWPEPKWRFHRMLSNPPFGVTWGGKDGYEAEARKLKQTRYRAGMPRVNDGALLFLQTMLAKMIPPEDGGSRVAIIFNGSPLSNGDCGSGESEIRRWILENDWLDAIVMLPDQLFYNTGIFTYIWLLRNEKPTSHRGRVMLIDARKQFEKEPKAFASKRNRMTDAHRQWIEERYRDGWANGYSDDQVKIFQCEDFAYHKVSVVFWQTDEQDKPAILTEPYERAFTGANLKKEQEFYDSDLTFRVEMKTAEGQNMETMLLTPKDDAVKKFKELMEGKPEIVSVEWTHRHYVQDDEYIPHGEDIETFLKREIAKPIIRWEDSPQLGYEILPNKYFYRYQPPTPAKDLLAEFWRLEKEAEKMLEGFGEMTIPSAASNGRFPPNTLKRFGTLLGGSGFPVEEQGYSGSEMEIPFFKVKDLAGPMVLTETDNFVSRETAARLGSTIFPESTIVFAKVGAALLLNRFRLLGGEGCLDNNMMAFSVKKPHSVAFFLHLLNNSDLSSNFNQGPVPSVNTRQVGALAITVPPPKEQQRIVAYLDASCAAVDAAVAAKRRQLETLDALRKSIIQRAVTRGISARAALESTGNTWMEQIPRGWKLVCLKRIAEIQGGLTLGKQYEGPLIERPYLRVGNVQDGHLDLADVSVIELPASVAASVELRPDDVLMTEGGDLDKLGRGYLWKGEIAGCLHQNHIFAVRCFLHKLKPMFLTYATAARYGRDYFEATGKKTTNLANTNATKVGEFPIPLPPLTEQEAICVHLNEKLGELKDIVTGIETQIATLTAYRKSLIHECVTGQRRISDADLAAVRRTEMDPPELHQI